MHSYNPQVATKVEKFSISLWTGIMRNHFHCNKIVATSSAIEAAFANLKHRLFKSELTMRINKFIIRHIESLQNKILAVANENIACKVKNTMENKENMWETVENWRGLTTKKKSNIDEFDLNQNQTQLKTNKKRKLSYLDDCPGWNNMKILQCITIPLLKNGNLLKASRCGDNFRNS